MTRREGEVLVFGCFCSESVAKKGEASMENSQLMSR